MRLKYPDEVLGFSKRFKSPCGRLKLEEVKSNNKFKNLNKISLVIITHYLK